MRLRKAIKKIVALGTGSTMIGATLLAASAANLADYPSPFVKDGVFNGKIVVGAQAAAQDVIGSIEIATGLQTLSVTENQVSVDGSSATTTLTGDSFKIEKSTDKLNLKQNLDPVDSVISSDLDALADGSLVNNYGTYRYEQVISAFNASSVVYDVDDDQSDDPALYLKFPTGEKVYTYRISFPTALETDVDSDRDYDDLDNKKLTLLGTEYTITNTDNATGTIELMGGAIQDTMQEYTKKTYNLNGKDYEVEIVAISSSADVIFKVNGEVSEKKLEGETIKLSDGTEIGVKTVLENEGTETGGGDLVTFYLGASKVVLADDDWSSGNTDGTLEYDGEELDDVMVDIVGDKSTSSKVTISKIEISWTAGEDFYVPMGGQLSEQLETDEKGFLFLENLDFNFAALQDNHNEDLVLKASGDDEYDFTISTTQGSVSKTVFYTNSSGGVELGEENYPIDTTLDAMAEKTRFFLTKNKDSYFLEVKQIEDDKVSFTNLVTGETSESSVISNEGTLLLSGSEFPFVTNATGLFILDANDGVFNGKAMFYTEDEFQVEIGLLTNGSGTYDGLINITEYKMDDTDTSALIQVLIPPKVGSVDMGASVAMTVDGSAAPVESWDSKDSYETGYTTYGTFIEWDKDDQDTVTFSIGDEAIVEVFITSGVTQVSTTGGATAGTVTTTTVNEIQVGSAVLDTEITDVTSDNYLVVGGPCANSVAARLVGVAQKIPECLSGLSLSEGEGVVKLFENGGKVSMLVAGATALDSQRASRVVAQHDKYPEFTGMEVSVTGTSLSDITVSAPTVTETDE